MKEKLNTTDSIEAEVETTPEAPARKPYKVISKAGLFKNGVQYDEGSTVELDEKTAKAFIEAGDIEDAG